MKYLPLVMAVGIGVHHQEDLAVAQLRQIERLAHTAAERADDVLQLLVREQLLATRLLRIEHLAAQRQDRLRRAVTALLGGPSGGVSLDDEELGVAPRRRKAVAELAGQCEAAARRAPARDLRGGGT